MPIDFSCSCGRHFHVADDKAGTRGKCPNCGQMVQVPAAPTPAPRTAAAPTAPAAAPPQAAQPRAMPQQIQAAPRQPIAPEPAIHSPQRIAGGRGYPAPAGYTPAPAALAPSPQVAAAPAYAEPSADGDAGPGFEQSAESANDPMAQAAAAYAAEHAYESPLSSKLPLGKKRRNLHSNRTFNLLGVGLLTGFTLPVFISNGSATTHTSFANMELIGDSAAPLAVRLFAATPLLASLAVFVVGNMTRGIMRGVIVAAIGVASYAVLFVDKDVRAGFDFVSSRDASTGMVTGMLFLCGLALMFAGILSLRRQPQYRPLSIIAIVGSVMFLVCLFIPQGKADSMPIVSVFSSNSDARSIGNPDYDSSPQICTAAAMVLMMAAAAYTIFLAATSRFSRKQGNIALAIAFGSLALTYLALGLTLNLVFKMFLIGSEGRVFIAAMIVAAKMCFWLGTLAMLIPVGFSELMLGIAEKQVGQGAPGFEVQMISGPIGQQPLQVQMPSQNPVPVLPQNPIPPRAFPPAPQPGFPPQQMAPPPMRR